MHIFSKRWLRALHIVNMCLEQLSQYQTYDSLVCFNYAILKVLLTNRQIIQLYHQFSL